MFSSSSNKPFLPDPAQEKTKEKELEVTNANTRVLEAMESQLRRKRPRGNYTNYSPELRAKIGKFAAESENKAAVEKFSKEVGKPVSESTVRGLKKLNWASLSRNSSTVFVDDHSSLGIQILMFRIILENFAYLVEWSIELLLSLPLRGLLNTTILHCCVSMETQFHWERNGQILCYHG